MKFSNAMTSILIQDDRHTELEKEKIRFGIQLIFNDLWKVLIIYIIALVLNCFIPTLVTHIAFILLRQVCFGFHFQNSWVCLISSIVSLPVALYLVDRINLDSEYKFLIGILTSLILLIIAPIGTKKRPVFNQKHRIYLRKKLIIRLFILWLTILFLKENYQTFIMYAILLITISVIIQKILGGENYENKSTIIK